MGSVQRLESLIMVVITEDRAMHEIITHSRKIQTVLYVIVSNSQAFKKKTAFFPK